MRKKCAVRQWVSYFESQNRRAAVAKRRPTQRVYDLATAETVELGRRIRAAREAKGLTRSDVVRALCAAGVTDTALYRIERGEFPVDRKRAERVREFLGVEVEESKGNVAQ